MHTHTRTHTHTHTHIFPSHALAYYSPTPTHTTQEQFSSTNMGYRILNDFCGWQKSVRESMSGPHFDVAVLVTRKGICESSSHKCGTLGECCICACKGFTDMPTSLSMSCIRTDLNAALTIGLNWYGACTLYI